MSPDDKLILASVKIKPSMADLEQLNNLIPIIQDWDYVAKTIIDRGIAPLFYVKLPILTNSKFIPVLVRTKLQQTYYITFSRSTVLYEHFRKIANQFTLHNIELIALKGICLSEQLYQDIGLRQMSDIDILVKPENGSKALAVLSDMGYKPVGDDESNSDVKFGEVVHYTPMVLNGVAIEVHIKLHQDNEKYRVIVEELWKNAVPVILNNVQVKSFNAYDSLIHTCVHLDKHFNQGHVQFTCFNDVTNLLEKNAGTFNWDILISTCKLYNCEKEVFKYIVLCNKYMNAVVPETILNKYSHYLSNKEEQLFQKYLSGYVGFTSGMHRHFGNFQHISSFPDRIRYFREILFPSKKFMLTKFAIKNPRLVYFYYPYRYFLGIKGVVLLARKRLFH
jgi:hypothetical protein